jgi:peptidylprolyl isomerase
MLRKALFITAAVLFTGNMLSAEDKTPQPTPATTPANEEISKADILRVSEAFGHFIGRNIKSPGIQLDIDSIIKGMRDGATGKPAPMNEKDYETLMMRVQESAFKKLSADNLAAANAYMEKNAKEKNVTTLEPGKLQYTTIKPGDGAVVVEHNSPQIEYTGKYIDGTTFGSSVDTGGPITIPLDQTIPGFSKGIIGMKEGEERRLFVHPDLGYGTSGHLAPNSLLIFDVKVVKANAPATDDDAANASGDGDDDGIEIVEIELDDSKAAK